MNTRANAIGIAVGLLLAIGGCAAPGDVAKEAVNANLAFERQNNDLLLLNVMRAAMDLPMHFSRINTLRLSAGTAGLSAKATYPPLAGVPVIGSGAQLNPTQRGGLELGVTGPALPALDVTPLDGQEFMQGIMTPVPMSTLPLMSELGWPTDLLMRLLLDSVSVPDAADPKVTHVYQNDPGHRTYADFVKYVDDLKLADCVLVLQQDTASVAWTHDFLAPGQPRPTLEGAAAAKAAGLGPFGQKDGKLVYGTTPNLLGLNCMPPEEAVKNDRAAEDAMRPTGNAAKMIAEWARVTKGRPVAPASSVDALRALRENFAVAPRAPAPGEAPPPVPKATLRSPYGVLAFLGALQRKGPNGTFMATSGAGEGAVIARADVLGRSYHVSASSAGTSTAKSLAIAWQLLQLQSKGTTMPVTGTVRLAQ